MSENTEKLPEIEQKMKDFVRAVRDEESCCLACFVDEHEDLQVGFCGTLFDLGRVCAGAYRHIVRLVGEQEKIDREQFLSGIFVELADFGRNEQ